jgi:predicted PurR-regulated permease PerM
VEPLSGGRYRIDLDALNLEIKPLENGRYLIGPSAIDVIDADGGGKWERAIKQWLATRLKSTEGESRRVLEYGQKFISGIAFGIGRLFLVLMVAAFILIDLDRIQGFLRSLVPERYQVDYDRIYVGVDRGLSGVIRGQLVICIINGIFTYVGLLLFHIKYPLLLAAIAATMSLIPIFGSILSSIPIVAVALISSGHFELRKGLFVLAWIIGIHLVEANLLNPKIMGNAAKIHPVLVVFALIAGEHSYGLVGALFAVPVASIIQTIFIYYRRRPKQPTAGAAPPPAITPATT